MTSRDSSQSGQSDGPTWARVASGLAKTGAAAALIAGVAFGIAVVGTDGEVSESHADIFDLQFGSQAPDQQQFEDSLASLGHDNPQSFELNGNIVHFSVDYRSEDPHEVAERYQREFVRNNINDRVYHSLDPDYSRELSIARLTGQIAPLRIRPGEIKMGGMITTNRASNEEELLELGQKLHRDDEVFRAHRWIEIQDDPDRDQTRVVATWSDDSFSFANMQPGETARTKTDRRRGTDTEVPACPGCVRVHQMDDLDEDRDYTTNIFVSEAHDQSVQRFYREAMNRRGWQLSEFQEAHDSLGDVARPLEDDQTVMFFERGDQKLEIFTYPVGDGETAAQTVLWGNSDRTHN